MKYTLPTIPDPLPENLDELKALADAVGTIRSTAETDVQDGREAMDDCDRILTKLREKVGTIMGEKAFPTDKEKIKHVTPEEVHQKPTEADKPKPGEKPKPHSPSA